MALFTFTTGTDQFAGTSAADTFNITLATHLGASDFAIGGLGLDVLNFTGTSGVLVVDDRIDEVESVVLGGTSAIGADASGGLTALSITGNSAGNAITGTFLNDTITGGAGNDTLSGGGGSDVFLVGAAADMGAAEVLNGGSGTDVLRYIGASGTLTLGALITNLEQVVVGTAAGLTTGTGAVNVDASALTYGISITGNAGANILTGSAYDDALFGGAGNDIFVIKDDTDHGANETIDGGAGLNVLRFTSITPSDTLVLSSHVSGITEAEISNAAGLNTGTEAVGIDASALTAGILLTGNAGANELTGGSGNDTINGGIGADALGGGGGNDIFVIATAAEHAVNEAIDGDLGIDAIRFGSTVAGQILMLDAAVTNVENIFLANAAGAATGAATHINASASTDNLNIVGNAARNSLTGGSGDDTLAGGGENDTLFGGAGNDLFLIGAPGEMPGAEQVIGGTDTNDVLRYTGLTAATLTIGAANLSGIDAIEVASAAGSFAGTGAINVNASTVSTGIRITGNDGANVITGGAGNDTLMGGGGNDTLVISNSAHHGAAESIDGGSGTDTIQFASTTAGQTLTLQSGVMGVENVVITSLVAQSVSAAALGYGLSITGNAVVNTITGTGFADTITGGAGNDVLIGGAGNDLFIVATPAHLTVGEQVNGGLDIDTLRLSGAGLYALTANVTGIERVEAAAGTASIGINASLVANALEITGNAGTNAITGTGGDDTITGGAGNDNLQGGGGNDVFVIGSGDNVPGEVINGGAGTADTIRFASTTAGDTLTLRSTVTLTEVVELASASGDGSGTTRLNVDASAQTVGLTVTGNDGDNVVTGGSGNDTLDGNDGNDLLAGLSGADLILGGGGNDSLTGGAGHDTLSGGGGNDIVMGGLGNDRIEIGDGELLAGDVMHGGTGTDTVALIGSGQSLNLDVVAVSGVEIFDLTGTGDNTLHATTAKIAALGATTVRVAGAAGDIFIGGENWMPGADTVIGLETYHQFTNTAAAGVTLQVDADVTFSVDIEISALNGANGFRVDGEAAGDFLGASAAAAGDVNGDGFADFIVGAWGAEPHASDSGNSYLVFGKASGFSSNLNVSTLNGANGFRIAGEAVYDQSGKAVASAGDVNGDGFGDFIVGAPGADVNGSNAGAGYVVFGKASGFASAIELSALNGTTGFQISGAAAGDGTAYSLGSAGDVNGDGMEDLIIGAYSSDANGSYSGAVYVVFGKASGFASNIQLSALNGADGFRIPGEAAGDLAGLAAASPGDVNGDGLDDIIIGANGADANGSDSGAGYLVFGRVSGFGSSFDLSLLDGTNGFQISGENAGDSAGAGVSAAGDVNGDGFADLIIGATGADTNGSNAGMGYVVFGKSAGFSPTFDLATLDGSNGFRIPGLAAGTYAGRSVSTAGDVNGDGFDDLLLATPFSDENGNNSGASHVLFGRASGFASSIDLENMGRSDGFRITGKAAGDRIGYSATAAGDVNGDGFDDLLVGALGIDTNGSNSGAGFVIFGRDFRFEADQIGGSGNDSFAGTAGDDILVGGLGNDTFTGGAGADAMNGGGGDDVFVIGANAHHAGDAIDGGAGNDVIRFTDSTGTLVIERGTTGIEEILTSDAGGSLAGSGAATVDAALAASKLAIYGNAGNNTLTGSAFADTITGGNGDDFIYGGRGHDSILGGAGFDRIEIQVEAGNSDYAHAGPDGGILAISGELTQVAIMNLNLADQFTDGGTDTLVQEGFTWLDAFYALNYGAHLIAHNTAGSTITGSYQADTIDGGSGDDVLLGLHGADSITGANGNDQLYDSAGDDTLDGGAGRDTIWGGSGNDSIIGGAGNDRLRGESGADSIQLGAADGVDDVFYLISSTDGAAAGAQTGYDNVTQFETAFDTVGVVGDLKDALDDIGTADSVFAFKTDAATDFSADEALLRTGLADADLVESGFATLVASLNALGITAANGADGLIVAQGATQTGIYYYQESSGADNIGAGELSLLAIVNGQLGTADFSMAA